MSSAVDPVRWPFEVLIEHDDGSHAYHQYARENGDGTVAVYQLELPLGFVERIYPKERARLRARPWDKAQMWFELYERVYLAGQTGTGR